MKWLSCIIYSALCCLILTGCVAHHSLSFITLQESYLNPVVYCYSSPVYRIKVYADTTEICPNPSQLDYYAGEALQKLNTSSDILKDIKVFVRYGTVALGGNRYAKGLSNTNGLLYIRSERLWYRTLQHEIAHMEIFRHPEKYKKARVFFFFHKEISPGDPEHELKNIWRKIDNTNYHSKE